MSQNNHYKNYLSMIALMLLGILFLGNGSFAQVEAGKPGGYGKASYTLSQHGKYFRNWLIAGPIPVSNDSIEPAADVQENAFKMDVITALNTNGGAKKLPSVSAQHKNFTWQAITATGDQVDLDSIFKGKDFVYAYALAEIVALSPMNVALGVGSDDAIKIWLNGELVHENWVPRGIVKDNDLVRLKLNKGSNQLLLKVQDLKGGWGFVARLLDAPALTEQLNKAAASGNIDKLNLLLESGADINATNENGISPIASAKVNGRDEVVQLLLSKGAVPKDVPSSEALVDNFYSSLKTRHTPGIALLAAKGDKVLYRKGFGYGDLKHNVPVTPDTKFRIGSVTKQFIAAAILKLQEKGLLSVTDKLSKFIPDFPRGDEVTIHHLLTHTSGIHSYTNNDDFISSVTKTITPDSLVGIIKKGPYDFSPGEKMLYNNSGYFLLGYIIGKVSGKPYEVYLKETFFDPLGMKNTGVHYAGIKLENEARGYSKTNDRYTEALNWDMSWAGGAGALYSTVDDLLKWNRALYEGNLLSEQSLTAALTPAVLNSGESPSMKYGYGLGLNNFRGKDIIGHSGGLHGFLTQLIYLPKDKFTVVMFTNTSEPEAPFDPARIAEAYLWESMDKQKSFVESAVKPANLVLYTGRFQLGNVGVIMVTTENNKLFAQLSGQAKYEIFPGSEDEFFWKVVDARIRFFKDDKGAISHAVLYQNGQEMEAKKIKEEEIIQIDPALMDKYTGKYNFKKDEPVTIFKENNKLYARSPDQPKVEMQPISPTEFVIKELNAKLSFVTDGAGKVTKAKLNMNGMDVEMPKIE